MPAKAKRTIKPRPKTAVRGEVIAQLAEVFRAHGYEGTSLSLITKFQVMTENLRRGPAASGANTSGAMFPASTR